MSDQLTLLTVNGHPDDESVMAGGTMARYAAEGVRVVCVVCTRGEAGEIIDPTMDTPENRACLGDIRVGELKRALGQLGPIESEWLGYRDSGMSGTPENQDPRAFINVGLDEATGRLVRIIRRVRPNVMITHNEFGGDGHPDHIRAAAVARAAFDRAGQPDVFPELRAEGLEPWSPAKLYESVTQFSRRDKLARLLRSGDPSTIMSVLVRAVRHWDFSTERRRGRMAASQSATTTRIEVQPWLEAKYAALAEHRTQIDPNGSMFTLTPGERQRVTPTEDFTLRASRVTADLPEDDLFAGLRGAGHTGTLGDDLVGAVVRAATPR